MLKLRIKKTMWHAVISQALLTSTMLKFCAFHPETCTSISCRNSPCNATYRNKNNSDSCNINERFSNMKTSSKNDVESCEMVCGFDGERRIKNWKKSFNRVESRGRWESFTCVCLKHYKITIHAGNCWLSHNFELHLCTLTISSMINSFHDCQSRYCTYTKVIKV